MNRIDRRPAISLAEYAHQQGVALASDYDFAEVIGGVFTARTRHAKGRVKRHIAALARTEALARRYDDAVASGEIPAVETSRPLQPDSAADRAYARAMARRLARLARLGGAA